MEGLRLLDEAQRDGGENRRRKKKMSSSTPDGPRPQPWIDAYSDSCARGDRADLSGPAVGELLRKRNFSLIGTEVVPDDQSAIQNAIAYWVQEAQLVVTTGGTGIAERDVTPEATRAVCERLLEGSCRTHALRRREEDAVRRPQPRRLRSARKIAGSESARKSRRRGGIARSRD